MLTLSGISKRFADKTVLNNVSFSCAHGERLSILGPSGCGKSTLLRIVIGLERPDSGNITFIDRSARPADITRHAAYLTQSPTLLPWLTAHDNALLPLRLARRLKADDKQQATALLGDFGLDAADKVKKTGTLSGGMRQRVALVQSMMVATNVLILDEPFCALDDLTRHDIVCQLNRWLAKNGIALVMVTHSFEDAAYLTNRALWFVPGKAGAAAQQYEYNLSAAQPTNPPCDKTVDTFSQEAFVKLKNELYGRYRQSIVPPVETDG